MRYLSQWNLIITLFFGSLLSTTLKAESCGHYKPKVSPGYYRGLDEKGEICSIALSEGETDIQSVSIKIFGGPLNHSSFTLYCDSNQFDEISFKSNFKNGPHLSLAWEETSGTPFILSYYETWDLPLRGMPKFDCRFE